MNRVIISIGSNIDALENIRKGLVLLQDLIEIKVVTPLEKTDPIGITEQECFTNGALLGYTNLNSVELNKKIKLIENQLGRDRTRPKFGPREIDFDIVEWNGQIVDDDYYLRDFLKKMVDWLKMQ